jgi:hypothetical protein
LVLASDQLQLEVFINDAPTKLIGSFDAIDGQRLAARRAELKEVGVDPGNGGATDIVALDEIAGLSYRYDVPGQRLYIIMPDTLRAIQVYEVVPPPDASPVIQAGYGAVLNYNLFAASTGKVSPSSFAFNGVSASLDARAFSPFGTLSGYHSLFRRLPGRYVRFGGRLAARHNLHLFRPANLDDLQGRRHHQRRFRLDEADTHRWLSGAAQFWIARGPRHHAARLGERQCGSPFDS